MITNTEIFVSNNVSGDNSFTTKQTAVQNCFNDIFEKINSVLTPTFTRTKTHETTIITNDSTNETRVLRDIYSFNDLSGKLMVEIEATTNVETDKTASISLAIVENELNDGGEYKGNKHSLELTLPIVHNNTFMCGSYPTENLDTILSDLYSSTYFIIKATNGEYYLFDRNKPKVDVNNNYIIFHEGGDNGFIYYTENGVWNTKMENIYNEQFTDKKGNRIYLEGYCTGTASLYNTDGNVFIEAVTTPTNTGCSTQVSCNFYINVLDSINNLLVSLSDSVSKNMNKSVGVFKISNDFYLCDSNGLEENNYFTAYNNEGIFYTASLLLAEHEGVNSVNTMLVCPVYLTTSTPERDSKLCSDRKVENVLQCANTSCITGILYNINNADYLAVANNFLIKIGE